MKIKMDDIDSTTIQSDVVQIEFVNGFSVELTDGTTLDFHNNNELHKGLRKLARHGIHAFEETLSEPKKARLEKFKASNPISLGSVINQENQLVEFFDPEQDGFVYAIIAGKILSRTEFMEVGDTVEPHGEYTPIYDVKSGMVLCGFEYYNSGECKPLSFPYMNPIWTMR